MAYSKLSVSASELVRRRRSTAGRSANEAVKRDRLQSGGFWSLKDQEIRRLRRIIIGLYSTGSFRSKECMRWIGAAADIYVKHPEDHLTTLHKRKPAAA